MRVAAFNGSARKDGNTARMVTEAFSTLSAAGVECKMFQLAGRPLLGCRGCYRCKENLVR